MLISRVKCLAAVCALSVWSAQAEEHLSYVNLTECASLCVGLIHLAQLRSDNGVDIDDWQIDQLTPICSGMSLVAGNVAEGHGVEFDAYLKYYEDVSTKRSRKIGMMYMLFTDDQRRAYLNPWLALLGTEFSECSAEFPQNELEKATLSFIEAYKDQ